MKTKELLTKAPVAVNPPSGSAAGRAVSAPVLWFEVLSAGDTLTAGGKGANLGEMTQAGLPVPPGFVVTAEAFLAALDEAGVRQELRSGAQEAAVDDAAGLEATCDRLQELVHKAGLSATLRGAVMDAYRRLGDSVPVAVRSSATGEDTAGTSFAGMNQTFTNVTGEEELETRILDCWTSLYGPRVVAYRASRGVTDEPAIAVVVQEMVASKRSGVIFSADPATGDRSNVVIEAAFGLGEVVVSGQVEPDTYVVAKDGLRLLSARVGLKQEKIVRGPDGADLRVTLAPADAASRVLSDDEVLDVAASASMSNGTMASPRTSSGRGRTACGWCSPGRSRRWAAPRRNRRRDAEVAWAANCYVEWSGDEEFARGPGLLLLVETARYWASRMRQESDGTAHIYGVIGPDEYHEPVDDNAFTNVMARWNLRRAAAATDAFGDLDGGVGAGEVDRWRALADAVVDGWDPHTGVYEQFAGFRKLESLIIADVAPRRPIAADLLLGTDRVRRAQVLKQADVLMHHHLVPDEVMPGTLDANLRYYEPRTAHGSSLSPSIHASLFARARDFDRALEALHIGSRIDLDDLTGSTAGGLHLATMGGLWQALAFGFCGLRPAAGRLEVSPRLPPAWSRLDLRVRFRGARVRVRTERTMLTIEADAPTPIAVDGDEYTAGPASLTFDRRGAKWEVTE